MPKAPKTACTLRPMLNIKSLILAVALLVLPAAGHSETAHSRDLFGKREIRSTRLTAFAKWRDMLDRHVADTVAHVRSGDCIPAAPIQCGFGEWERLIDDAAAVPLADMLESVNSHMNRAPYITDPINWGMPDYWATIRQFFIKDGDCEDYAIAKYFTLKRLGIDASSMRIVVLQDENLGVPHAVLTVADGGDIWVLDNQIDRVVSHRVIRHYRPIYSINETAWWLHHD